MLNKEYYLTPYKVSSIDAPLKSDSQIFPRKNVVAVSSPKYEQAAGCGNRQIEEIVFEYDCLDTPQVSSVCGMWHIFALSSVLGQPVGSIYPPVNAYYRPAFDKVAIPRAFQVLSTRSIQEHGDECFFLILWTRTRPMLHEEFRWMPNHFVPCVRKCHSPGVPSKTHLQSITPPLAYAAAAARRHSVTPPVSLSCSTANVEAQCYQITSCASSSKTPTEE